MAWTRLLAPSLGCTQPFRRLLLNTSDGFGMCFYTRPGLDERVPGTFGSIVSRHAKVDWSTVPLDALFDRLLTWCIFLGFPRDAGNTVDTVDAGNSVGADNAVDSGDAGKPVNAGDTIDAVDEVVLWIRNKSCVVSYFCPSSCSYRCFQRSLGTGHIPIVASHRFGNPHLSPSMRSPPAHVTRLI